MELELEDDPQIRAYIKLKINLLIAYGKVDQQDTEDVEQALYLQVIRAMPLFDPKRSKRITFVSVVVDRQTNSLLRHYNALKRVGRTISLSTLIEVDGESNELAQVISDRDLQRHYGSRKRTQEELAALQRDVQACLDRLSTPLKRLAILLQTHTLSEAARMMGIPRQTAQFRLVQIRRHFKNDGLEDYLSDPSAD